MQKLNYLLIAFLLCIFNLVINAQTVIHRDSSNNFLTDYSGGLPVAEVPPAIDFGIGDIGESSPDLNFTHWGNIVLGPDDKYYYAIGDHNTSGTDGTVILKSYDPSTQTDEICIYSPDVVPKLADGKWHGRPTIDPSTGDMYLIGFYGGQVVKYNIYSKEVTNYGQVVPGAGWEEHIWDYERKRLYGIGPEGVLVYDTENNIVVSSGQPFPDFNIGTRSRMLDNETGIFYGTVNYGTFYKYNPETKNFTKLSSKLSSDLRAYSNIKGADGSFWVFDMEGDMYSFFPEKDSLVSRGMNADKGEYVAFMERSPKGNYLYYISTAREDRHLIQYNTNTDEKKVIAQLSDYFVLNHDYFIQSFYGGALSRDGKSLFLVCSGIAEDGKRPAMLNVHIPQSERLMSVSYTIYLTATSCDSALAGIDTVAFVNQYGCDSLVITETEYIPADLTQLTTTTCNPLHVGIDTVILTNQFNCDSLVITETTLLPSDTLNLTESINQGGSYQVGDSVFTETGNYSIILINQHSCDSIISLNLTVEEPVNIISINENKARIKIYPNPTEGEINLSFENVTNILRINIISATGRIIINKEYNPLNGKITEQIDLNNYSNGIYLIEITSGKFRKLDKFILNR